MNCLLLFSCRSDTFEDYFNIFYLIEVTCSFDYYCYYWLTRIYFRNMQFPIEMFATLLFMSIYSPYATAAAAHSSNLFHFYRTQTYNMNAIFAIDNCFRCSCGNSWVPFYQYISIQSNLNAAHICMYPWILYCEQSRLIKLCKRLKQQ